MKIASLLAHLSGFEEPVALVCPVLEERIKYRYALQPADYVFLPVLGEQNPIYSKCVIPLVFIVFGVLHTLIHMCCVMYV